MMTSFLAWKMYVRWYEEEDWWFWIVSAAVLFFTEGFFWFLLKIQKKCYQTKDVVIMNFSNKCWFLVMFLLFELSNAE